MLGIRTFLRSTSSSDRTSTEGMSMPSSPSFSDFSCGVQSEASGPQSGAPVLEPASPLRSFQSLHRGSLDSNVVSGLAGYRSGSPTQAEGSSSLWSRLSLDGAAPSPKAGRPNLSTASVPVSPSFHHHSAAMNIPQLRPASPTPADDAFAQTAPTGGLTEQKPRTRSGRPERIDGMDYYSWCELLRSSSL